MTFFRGMLFVCPLVCALAQTPPPGSRQATPVPPPAPEGAPAQAPGSGGQPAPGSRTFQIPIPTPPPQMPPDTIVLRVGDIQLTVAQFNTLADLLAVPYRGVAKTGGRKQFADQIAKVLVLADEARRRKLNEKPEFQLQSTYRDAELLASYALTAINDSIRIDDAALREYYEAHKSDYERVHARHILVRMEGSPAPLKAGAKDLTDAEALAKAQSLLQRIKAGEDFAKIAAAESDDDGSAINFGDLGWFGRGQLAPSLEEAAFQLQTGQISEPVKSQLGYHILQVEGSEFRSFDEVKEDVEKKIRPEKMDKALDDLERSVKIDYNAAFFESAKQ
jgi:peptidyl-prolyl cis-trans isomerase C